MVEDDGVGHEHHRQHEVAHHQRRVEVEEDDEAAEDDLADHPEDEAGGQPDQVPPVRPAPQGGQDGDDDHDRHRPRHHAVHELDEGVVLERRHDPALGAGRPVGAAEARTGHPHGPAGDNDEAQGEERHEGDTAVAGGRDGESVTHLTQGLPIAAFDAATGCVRGP